MVAVLLRPVTLHLSKRATYAAILEGVDERVAATVEVSDELNHVAQVSVRHDVESRHAGDEEERRCGHVQDGEAHLDKKAKRVLVYKCLVCLSS